MQQFETTNLRTGSSQEGKINMRDDECGAIFVKVVWIIYLFIVISLGVASEKSRLIKRFGGDYRQREEKHSLRQEESGIN